MRMVYLSDMVSPFDGQAARLVRGREWVGYGGKTVVVESEWFQCQTTGEEFTSLFQDDAYCKALRRALGTDG